MMKSRVFLELKSFLLVGVIGVCLDWGFYLTLTYFFGVGVVLSKALAYTIGTIFAFIASGKLVFQVGLLPIAFLKHLLVYAFSLSINTLVFASWESKFFSNSPMSLSAALLTATLASTVINFVGMRFWVFKSKRKSHARG